MTQTASSLEELFARVAVLSTPERTTLARWILQSIEFEQAEKDPGYDEAWRSELKRRATELEEHPERAIPWEQVRAELIAIKDAAQHPA
jgi:putative addiction module component (TIGR02574 family)